MSTGLAFVDGVTLGGVIAVATGIECAHGGCVIVAGQTVLCWLSEYYGFRTRISGADQLLLVSLLIVLPC